MNCPRCHDRYLVTAQCAPATRVPGCTQDGTHEHRACTKCMAEWTEPMGYQLEPERMFVELPPGYGTGPDVPPYGRKPN